MPPLTLLSMGNFGVNLLPDSLRADLVAGEIALAYENATILVASDRSGKERKQPRAVDGFSFDPVVGGIQPEDGYFDTKLSGIGAEGEHGARAQQVLHALNHGGTALLLTNLRLAVVGGMPSRVLLSIPAGEIASIRGAPRLLQFGRIEIGFRDGSVVRPNLALLIPRASGRFLRAFETGQPQS